MLLKDSRFRDKVIGSGEICATTGLIGYKGIGSGVKIGVGSGSKILADFYLRLSLFLSYVRKKKCQTFFLTKNLIKW